MCPPNYRKWISILCNHFLIGYLQVNVPDSFPIRSTRKGFHCLYQLIKVGCQCSPTIPHNRGLPLHTDRCASHSYIYLQHTNTRDQVFRLCIHAWCQISKYSPIFVCNEQQPRYIKCTSHRQNNKHIQRMLVMEAVEMHTSQHQKQRISRITNTNQ